MFDYLRVAILYVLAGTAYERDLYFTGNIYFIWVVGSIPVRYLEKYIYICWTIK